VLGQPRNRNACLRMQALREQRGDSNLYVVARDRRVKSVEPVGGFLSCALGLIHSLRRTEGSSIDIRYELIPL
jgi:hypothetical protein